MTRDRSDVAHLLAFLRPHGRPLVGGLALGLASSSVALALPLVTKRLLDGLSGGAGLGPSVALLLGLLLVGGLLGLAQWVLLGSLAERIVLSARTSLVRRLFGAEVSHLTRHRTGELVTRATSDTVLLREATSQSVVEIVNGVVLLTGTLVLMAVLDPVLLGVTLAVLAVVGAGVGVLLPRVGRAHRDAQEALGELGGTLEAGLRAVRTVKANRAEGREARRVVALAERSAAHAVRAVRGEALVWTVGSNGAHLAVIAVLAVGAWRVQSGELGVSTLVAFLLYAFGLVEPATGLSTQVAQLQSGAAAARRLHDLQQIPQEPTDLPSPRGAVPAEAVPDPLLRLRSLTVHHPDAPAPALADVSLDLPRRGRIALVGPSGAGKTTLFGVLLRFTAPTTGTVELDGVDTAAQTPQEVRRRFAYVEQETPLIAGSVRDNLLLPDPDAPEAALWEALERVGLAERVRRLPAGLDESLAGSVLSGGERQRVALARAVLHAPDVLLLDEATAQLDGLTEEAVHAVLADLARDRLVVTIAHRLSTVLDADEVVLLDGGRVRARGRHDDLVRDDELYRRLAASMGLVPA